MRSIFKFIIKNFQMRLVWFLVITLTIGLFYFPANRVSADEKLSTFEILEIEPSDNFQLAPNNAGNRVKASRKIDGRDVYVTSVPMPEFIGQVDSLNGRYDAVLVGRKLLYDTKNAYTHHNIKYEKQFLDDYSAAGKYTNGYFWKGPGILSEFNGCSSGSKVEMFGAWPGQRMNRTGYGQYEFTMPEGFNKAKVIFSKVVRNWGNYRTQYPGSGSEGLVITEGNSMRFTGTGNGGWNSAYNEADGKTRVYFDASYLNWDFNDGNDMYIYAYGSSGGLGSINSTHLTEDNGVSNPYYEYLDENDITNKRASEILSLINSNQLVYVDKNIVDSSSEYNEVNDLSGSKLYKNFKDSDAIMNYTADQIDFTRIEEDYASKNKKFFISCDKPKDDIDCITAARIPDYEWNSLGISSSIKSEGKDLSNKYIGLLDKLSEASRKLKNASSDAEKQQYAYEKSQAEKELKSDAILDRVKKLDDKIDKLNDSEKEKVDEAKQHVKVYDEDGIEIDSSENPGLGCKKSRNIKFNVNVSDDRLNDGDSLIAKVYLDINGDSVFSDKECYCTQKVQYSAGGINIKLNDLALSDDFIGDLQYKVEVTKKCDSKDEYNFEEEKTETKEQGVKSYVTGLLRYHAIGNNKRTLKVLQILPYDKNQYNRDNNSDNNLIMDQDYGFMQKMNVPLIKSNYDINIESMVVDDVNYRVSSDRSFLNNYQMIVVGFSDGGINVQHGHEVSEDLSNALKGYIKDGHGVMFTHDTLPINIAGTGRYNGDPNTQTIVPYGSRVLGKNFRDYMGQSRFTDPSRKYSENGNDNAQDDLMAVNKQFATIPHKADDNLLNENACDGFSGGNGVTFGYSNGMQMVTAEQIYNSSYNGPGAYFTEARKAFKINQGIINTYPYKLNENISVNDTHNQWFQLNLEDPDVVPWYSVVTDFNNECGKFMSKYYVRSNYYTYSKGNVTYSGTGHSDIKSGDEYELYVNTIIKAERSSNHAPKVVCDLPIETNSSFEKANELYSGVSRNISISASDADGNDVEEDVKVQAQSPDGSSIAVGKNDEESLIRLVPVPKEAESSDGQYILVDTKKNLKQDIDDIDIGDYEDDDQDEKSSEQSEKEDKDEKNYREKYSLILSDKLQKGTVIKITAHVKDILSKTKDGSKNYGSDNTSYYKIVIGDAPQFSVKPELYNVTNVNTAEGREEIDNQKVTGAAGEEVEAQYKINVSYNEESAPDSEKSLQKLNKIAVVADTSAQNGDEILKKIGKSLFNSSLTGYDKAEKFKVDLISYSEDSAKEEALYSNVKNEERDALDLSDLIDMNGKVSFISSDSKKSKLSEALKTANTFLGNGMSDGYNKTLIIITNGNVDNNCPEIEYQSGSEIKKIPASRLFRSQNYNIITISASDIYKGETEDSGYKDYSLYSDMYKLHSDIGGSKTDYYKASVFLDSNDLTDSFNMIKYKSFLLKNEYLSFDMTSPDGTQKILPYNNEDTKSNLTNYPKNTSKYINKLPDMKLVLSNKDENGKASTKLNYVPRFIQFARLNSKGKFSESDAKEKAKDFDFINNTTRFRITAKSGCIGECKFSDDNNYINYTLGIEGSGSMKAQLEKTPIIVCSKLEHGIYQGGNISKDDTDKLPDIASTIDKSGNPLYKFNPGGNVTFGILTPDIVEGSSGVKLTLDSNFDITENDITVYKINENANGKYNIIKMEKPKAGNAGDGVNVTSDKDSYTIRFNGEERVFISYTAKVKKDVKEQTVLINSAAVDAPLSEDSSQQEESFVSAKVRITEKKPELF